MYLLEKGALLEKVLASALTLACCVENTHTKLIISSALCKCQHCSVQLLWTSIAPSRIMCKCRVVTTVMLLLRHDTMTRAHGAGHTVSQRCLVTRHTSHVTLSLTRAANICLWLLVMRGDGAQIAGDNQLSSAAVVIRARYEGSRRFHNHGGPY